jgi:hypothetical protein
MEVRFTPEQLEQLSEIAAYAARRGVAHDEVVARIEPRLLG